MSAESSFDYALNKERIYVQAAVKAASEGKDYAAAEDWKNARLQAVTLRSLMTTFVPLYQDWVKCQQPCMIAYGSSAAQQSCAQQFCGEAPPNLVDTNTEIIAALGYPTKNVDSRVYWYELFEERARNQANSKTAGRFGGGVLLPGSGPSPEPSSPSGPILGPGGIPIPAPGPAPGSPTPGPTAEPGSSSLWPWLVGGAAAVYAVYRVMRG